MIYAKYTIVLKTLLDDPESKSLIDDALSTYPLHVAKNDPNFVTIPLRAEINKKLLDHYKYREIGFETFGRFLDELEISMNEIMPFYNQLLNSEDIINGLEDIFGNLDVTESFEQETSGSSSSDTSSSESATASESVEGSGSAQSSGTDSSTTSSSMDSNNKNVEVDTPQSQLDVTADNIGNLQYASNMKLDATSSESSGSSSGTTSANSTTTNTSETTKNSSGSSSIENTGTTSGTTTHTLTRKGNQGVNTYAHDMLEFRELFQNVIQMIINDKRISELFMGVY